MIKFDNDQMCSGCAQGKMKRASHPPKPEQGSTSPLSLIHMDLCGPMKTEQNGVVERRNRTLVEAARSMLAQSQLPQYLWAEAVNTACYTQNRSIIHRRFGKTPYHLLFGRIPNVDYFKVFGCPCFVLNETENRGKFGTKSDEMIFVGYSDCSVAYRVMNKKLRVVYESVNVKFDPLVEISLSTSPTTDPLSNNVVITDASSSASSSTKPSASTTELDLLFEYFYDDLYGTNQASTFATCLSSTPSSSNLISSDVTPVSSPDASDVNIYESSGLSSPTSDSVVAPLLPESDMLDTSSSQELSDHSEPVSTQPVLVDVIPNSLSVNDQTPLPNTAKWTKDHPIELIIGDPTSSVQTRAATANEFNFSVFLSSIEPTRVSDALQDSDWVTAMQEELNQFSALKVWRLVKLPDHKSIIDTKWLFKNKRDANNIIVRNKARLVAKGYRQQEGFKKGSVDSTLFLMKEGEHIVVIQIYVDDIIFGSTSRELCKTFETVMTEEFKMSMMGEINFFLGLQVRQFSDGIFINQSKYISDLLKKYDMSGCNSIGTPMATGNSLVPDHEGKDVDLRNYRSMVGSLMYLTTSRPDIMFATCVCSRYQAKPKESHLAAVKRIFRYLKGTPYYGIWYPKGLGFELQAYTDADYGGCNMDRKSTSGHLQFLGNKLVSWASKKQQCVSTSTAESEYVAAASCCSQVLWMQSQLRDYGLEYKKIPIYCDSKSAIAISANPVQHSKTKHIDISCSILLFHLFSLVTNISIQSVSICQGGACFIQVGTTDVVMTLQVYSAMENYYFPDNDNMVVPNVLSVQSTQHDPSIDADRQLLRSSSFLPSFSNNVPFNPHAKMGAPVITAILRNHPLYTVLTKTVQVPTIYVQQVWHTLFGVNMFRHVLGFPAANSRQGAVQFEPFASLEVAMAGVRSVGHTTAINAASQFNKSRLPKTYNTLFTILSRCLTGKRTAQDSATQSFLIFFYGVLFDKHYDYASLVFYDLKELLAKRQTHLPFPRFLSILIASAMERNPSIPRRAHAEMVKIHDMQSIRYPKQKFPPEVPLFSELLAYADQNVDCVREYRNRFAPMVQPEPAGPTQGVLSRSEGLAVRDQ
ncbi:hypothetical protein OSB04_028992 [Centaurea solstitialis]|uniref:Integrase catalytic domain-containing protein n=1 Tax=Centaurea solstitialis TaxID=347529 RepID=A0AA38STQ7_9ASTR|nr:hypothetical protein OSB04_028992 [Centaurea solstitialis]